MLSSFGDFKCVVKLYKKECVSWGSAAVSLSILQGEKRQPYEEDIRVPLIVRGPNVAPDTRTSSIALSIDLVGGWREGGREREREGGRGKEREGEGEREAGREGELNKLLFMSRHCAPPFSIQHSSTWLE